MFRARMKVHCAKWDITQKCSQIDGLPRPERIRVVAAIEQLPNGSDIKPLKGHDGFLRLRVGSYRIISLHFAESCAMLSMVLPVVPR